MEKRLVAIQQRDRRELWDRFAQAADPTWLGGLAAATGEALDRRFEVLGQGRHCRTWRLRPVTLGGLTLVYKRFVAGSCARPGPDRRRFLEHLAQAAGIGGLWPPTWLQESSEGALAMVMPFAGAPATAAAEHWQPLGGHVDGLDRQLRALGLVLDDRVQIRCVGSVPMVIDLSDLRRRGPDRGPGIRSHGTAGGDWLW